MPDQKIAQKDRKSPSAIAENQKVARRKNKRGCGMA
jgi:hypothetical protein